MTTDVKQSEAESTPGHTPLATMPTLFARGAAALAGQAQSGDKGLTVFVSTVTHLL